MGLQGECLQAEKWQGGSHTKNKRSWGIKHTNLFPRRKYKVLCESEEGQKLDKKYIIKKIKHT